MGVCVCGGVGGGGGGGRRARVMCRCVGGGGASIEKDLEAVDQVDAALTSENVCGGGMHVCMCWR